MSVKRLKDNELKHVAAGNAGRDFAAGMKLAMDKGIYAQLNHPGGKPGPQA